MCGYLSGCFGWAVVAFFETGGALIRSAGPTWAMQVLAYVRSLVNCLSPRALRLKRVTFTCFVYAENVLHGESLLLDDRSAWQLGRNPARNRTPSGTHAKN